MFLKILQPKTLTSDTVVPTHYATSYIGGYCGTCCTVFEGQAPNEGDITGVSAEDPSKRHFRNCSLPAASPSNETVSQVYWPLFPFHHRTLNLTVAVSLQSLAESL